MKALSTHGRFAYSPIGGRPRYAWPNGGRLALYIGFNVEHFAFGAGPGRPARAGGGRRRRAQPFVARLRQSRRRLALPRAVRVARPAARGDRQQRGLRSRAGADRRLRRARRRDRRPRPQQRRGPGRDERRRRARAAARLSRAIAPGDRQRARRLALALDLGERGHARSARRDRLPLHAQLVSRRPADCSSRRAPARSGRFRIRRRSTTSR